MRAISALSPWFHAARPRTLPAAAVPVLLGSACAAAAGSFNAAPAFIALLFALLVQVACNFANDYGDYVKGADTAERLGPARAVVSGWVSPRAMRRAVALVVAAAFAVGLMLVGWGGPWLILVGVVCLLACLAYTAGPFPLAYHGLGDVFVLVFFGFVAVAFTAYVQCGFFPPSVWVAGFACGLLAVNILVVNNARDMETDAAAGKRTLVVRWGRGWARFQYAANFALALLAPVALPGMGFGVRALFPLLLLPAAVLLGRGFCAVSSARDYNPYLGRTAAFLLAYGLLLTLGIASGK